jgi:hypothetical protein
MKMNSPPSIPPMLSLSYYQNEGSYQVASQPQSATNTPPLAHKKIVAEWTDNTDSSHLIVLASLTSGLSKKDKSGINVKVTKDGLELTFSEKWDNFVLDVESFYHVFPKDSRESDAEYCLRKAAMMTSVSKLCSYGHSKALALVYIATSCLSVVIRMRIVLPALLQAILVSSTLIWLSRDGTH